MKQYIGLTRILAACAAFGLTPDVAQDASADVFPLVVEHKFGSTSVIEAPQRVVSIGFTEQDALLAVGVVPVKATRTGRWSSRPIPNTRAKDSGGVVRGVRKDGILRAGDRGRQPDSASEHPAWADIRIRYATPQGEMNTYDVRVEVERYIDAIVTTGDERTYSYPQYVVMRDSVY